MKRNLLLINFLLIFPLLSSCSINNNEEDLNTYDLNNPLLMYSFLNEKYNKEDFNYYSTSEYLLTSKRGNSQTLKSFKIKNNDMIYQQKGAASELFGNKSIKRFYSYSDNNYGVSVGNEEIINENYLTSSSYSTLSFINEETYLNDNGEELRNITNFEIYKNYEELSFNDYKILNEDKDFITYSYTLSLETIKKMDAENSNDISTFSKINAINYEKNEILNFVDFSSISFIDASFELLLNKNSLEIEKINVKENLKISSIEFIYTYETTFKTYQNLTLLDSFYKDLIDDIDESIKIATSLGKNELYSFYVELNKRYKNLNYYTYTDSSVTALGGIYSQTVKGFKLKKNNEYFFQTVTTSAFVKKAELRYENENNNSYWIASGNNPDSSTIYGNVSSWNEWEKESKEEYLSILGHTMENLTNYTIDKKNFAKSFLDASYSEDDQNKIYTYKLSINEDETHIDSTKEYKVEMAHMSGMGEPSFSYSTMEIYISKKDDSINKIVQKEEYKTGSFECDSTMNTYFKIYENENEIPSEISTLYKEKIGDNN